MKNALWSIAAATLIILTGCSNTAAPIQPEDPPSRSAVETVLEDAAPVESKAVALSAGNDQLVDDAAAKEDTEGKVEPEPQAEPPAESQPQESEPQATVKASITFVPDSKKETAEPAAPAPSETTQAPEPEPTPTPAPTVEPEPLVEPAPPAASEPTESADPTFSIDHWISYAQEYAKSIGLNLDSTAVDCWDNPITAGAHCTCLERDIQSRLNRYAKDETILDVWVWAESRADGSYNLYIGYA